MPASEPFALGPDSPRAPRHRLRRVLWISSRRLVTIAPETLERAEATLRRRFQDRVRWRLR